MLETREAVDNINEILQVPGINVLHLGPFGSSLFHGVDLNCGVMVKSDSVD